MNKLILVRAGSTAWQETAAGPDDQRLQGTVPLPLSEPGKRALQEIAAQLQRQKSIAQDSLEYLYSSGNESSGPTADYLAELCHLKTKEIASLRELDCGLWQGLRIAEIKKRYGKAYRQWQNDPTSVCPPQGESIQDTLERVKESLDIIDKKNHKKTIIIVAAQIVAALIECCLTEKKPHLLWKIADEQPPLRLYEQLYNNIWTIHPGQPNDHQQKQSTNTQQNLSDNLSKQRIDTT